MVLCSTSFAWSFFDVYLDLSMNYISWGLLVSISDALWYKACTWGNRLGKGWWSPVTMPSLPGWSLSHKLWSRSHISIVGPHFFLLRLAGLHQDAETPPFLPFSAAPPPQRLSLQSLGPQVSYYFIPFQRQLCCLYLGSPPLHSGT